MVFSGTGPSDERIEHLTRLIREIKRRHKIEVCVSPGVIDAAQARRLKDAGLDRLNHNLNTSEAYYCYICTSHTYADRLRTLEAAHSVGLAVCSGVIVGMGEKVEDVYGMAKSLRDLGAESIPVNFLIPIPGIALKEAKGLTPEYCLRVLCLFRFLNPKAEIRMAAGREMHLRSLEPFGLLQHPTGGRMRETQPVLAVPKTWIRARPGSFHWYRRYKTDVISCPVAATITSEKRR